MLSQRVLVIGLQQLSLKKKINTLRSFKFHWPYRLKSKPVILISRKKLLLDKSAREKKTDLVEYLYFLSLNL